MQKHWLHPLNLLVISAGIVTILIWTIETFFSVGNSMAQLGGSSMAMEGWNWAHIISAVFWIVLFSGGVVGCVVNLSHAIRLSGKTTKDFSELKSLTEDEIEDLNLWLDSNTYGPEHLKELWGERKQ